MSDTPSPPEQDTPAPEAPRRISRWDRPKPPHDWRWIVGGIGRTLIALGLLLFGFVAYQLWGTGIQTAQAQRTLVKDFNRQIAAVSTSTSTTTTTTTTVPTTTATTEPVTVATEPSTTTSTTSTLPPGQPIPALGEAVARLEIPRIDVNRIVVEGAGADELKKGPGHFPETPLPGQLGNAAIAGHRTTHLHPFYDIDKLDPGDEIIVTTLNGHYVYRVTGTDVVSPDDYAQVIPTTDPTKATLTLVSCTPKYSSSHRIVVHSELDATRSDPLTVAAPAGGATALPDDTTETTAATVATTTVPLPTSVASTAAATTTATSTTAAPTTTTTTTTTVPASGGSTTVTPPDAFTDGWFSDAAGIPQALAWGALLAAIGYGIYWLSRKVRRYWVGILAGFVPFVVVLYFFYENVNRLLPPNL
jgi:sortase A